MSEPTTVLTDYLLAAVALGLAWRLCRSSPRPSCPARLWAASFAALGVAALVGGTWHGLPAGAWPLLRRSLWSITYVAIGLADLLILAGATRAALTRWPTTAVVILLTARFLTYAGLVVERREFRYIAIEFGVTVFVLFVFALDLARRREPAAVFVLGGTLLSFGGGLVLWLGLSPHAQFNNNDVFHLIQTGGIWLFFQGARRLRVRGGASETSATRPRC